MEPQNHPLRRRNNTIADTEVHKYIHDLKCFLGNEALSKAQSNLDKDLAHHGQCYSMWMQQVQQWLFTFRHYEQISANGSRTPKLWSESIQQMVGDAVMIQSLVNGMPETIRDKYRKDLLSVQHNAFMFEIRAAWHYHLEGFEVEWYPLSHAKSSEFRVRGGGLDFDVECRRFSLDLRNRVKMTTMADVCDMLHNVLLRCDFWGEVAVRFSDEFDFEPRQLRLWQHSFKNAVDTGQTELQLDGGLSLTLTLSACPSRRYSRDDLMQFITGPGTTWLVSKEDGISCSDPVIFHCSSPRKTDTAMRDYVYKTLRDKVNTQLSESRAGVVFVKFSGIKNPEIFNKSDGINGAVNKLFHRKHLAAIVLLGDDVARRDGGVTIHSAPSILFRNQTASFPNVAAANHQTRH